MARVLDGVEDLQACATPRWREADEKDDLRGTWVKELHVATVSFRDGTDDCQPEASSALVRTGGHETSK